MWEYHIPGKRSVGVEKLCTKRRAWHWHALAINCDTSCWHFSSHIIVHGTAHLPPHDPCLFDTAKYFSFCVFMFQLVIVIVLQLSELLSGCLFNSGSVLRRIYITHLNWTESGVVDPVHTGGVNIPLCLYSDSRVAALLKLHERRKG